MEKKLYLNNMLTAALILGALVSLPSYVLWIFSIDAATIGAWSWIQTIYLVAVTIVTLKAYGKKAADLRDPDLSLGFSYGAAFGFSMLTALLSSVIVALFSWILVAFLNPVSITQALELAEQAILTAEPNATQEMIDMGKSMTEFFFSYPGMLLSSIFSMAIWGGLAGLITSALIKRAPQPQDLNQE